MKTESQYKEMSIKEFTKAAAIYDSGHAGIYEMCKDDYPVSDASMCGTLFKEIAECLMK